jgi:predicted CoA-substrate-specific enzyme activase
MVTKNDAVKKVGLPHMGVYSTLIAEAINYKFSELGIDCVKFVVAPRTTKRTINCGAQCMDENMCLPAKIVFGNILEILKIGINFIIEWDNCGDCRQKTYGLLHQSVLRQLGINSAEILPLQPKGFIKQFAQNIPEVSEKQWKMIMRQVLREVWVHDLDLMKKQIDVPKGKPKIGIVGEIYTVLEPAANAGLLQMLEKYGAYVHNALNLSQFLFGSLLAEEKSRTQIRWLGVFAYLGMWEEIYDWCRGRMRRPDIDHKLFRKAEVVTSKYLGDHEVGGHGRESITWSIYYALSGFDGVVHIMPFPCMPEATVSRLLDEVAKDYDISITHLVFDQQLGEQNIITRAEALVKMLEFKKKGITFFLKKRSDGFFLGTDTGSTTTKATVVNGRTLEVIDSLYQRSHRDPIHTLQEVLDTLLSRNSGVEISGIGVTGSGRRLAQALLGNNTIAIDEISCQTIGCMLVNPKIRTIIEIGGQDSKVIFIDKQGVPFWFNMNSICSAGTGAFLDTLAKEFGVHIDVLNDWVSRATCPTRITGRCAVFAQSDMVSKQQQGESKDNLVKGMFVALVENYLSSVCRSQKLIHPIMFTGGVALNSGVVDAFSESFGKKVIVHPYTKVSGALGAAFVAMASGSSNGSIDLSNIGQVKFGTHKIICSDCSNNCEISLTHKDGIIVFAPGSVCGKYDAKIGRKIEEVS